MTWASSGSSDTKEFVTNDLFVGVRVPLGTERTPFPRNTTCPPLDQGPPDSGPVWEWEGTGNVEGGEGARVGRRDPKGGPRVPTVGTRPGLRCRP